MKLALCQVYLSLDINHEQILHMLTELEPQVGVIANLRHQVNIQMAEKILPVEVKHRRNLPDLQFAVGMVMQHRKYHYTCIIYGWDEKCTESSEWMERVINHRHSYIENLTFFFCSYTDGRETSFQW